MSDRVEEVRERVEKATPGPWECRSWMAQEGSDEVDHSDVARAGDMSSVPIADLMSEPDAEFIANAPSDIRFLLSEIQRLRKVEEAARDFGERIVAYVDILEIRGAADRGDLTLRDGTDGARVFLSSLSKTPEQQVPEPVREER